MRKLLLGFGFIALASIGTGLSVPTTGYCFGCEEKIGIECTGDYSCSPYTCNLKCVKVNRFGGSGRCMVSQ